MQKWILAIAGVLAFAFADPARAIVQESSTTVSKPDTVPSATITITQKTATGQPTGTPTKISTGSRRTSRPTPVRVDDEKTKTIEIMVEGRDRPTVLTLEQWRAGGTFDLGGGITVGTTPAVAQRPRTPATPRTSTGGPRTPIISEVVRPMDSFSGFYVGGHLSVSRGTVGMTEVFAETGEPTTNSFRERDTGVGGGLHFRYHMPQGNGWTLTPFLGFDFPGQNIRHNFEGGGHIGENTKFIATAGLQAGFQVTPEIQLYGLGGVSLADKKYTFDFGEPNYSREVKWSWGGTLGAGVAMRVPGWQGGYVYAQYQHFWLQDAHVDMPTASPAFNYTFDNDMDMFKVGASFPFDSAWRASDSRLKRDIEPVARLDSGLGLYRYRYLWSDTEYVGVMAQEVVEIRPEAVQRGADGFLRVDYSQLGTRLMTWAEWRLRPALAGTFVIEGAE